MNGVQLSWVLCTIFSMVLAATGWADYEPFAAAGFVIVAIDIKGGE